MRLFKYNRRGLLLAVIAAAFAVGVPIAQATGGHGGGHGSPGHQATPICHWASHKFVYIQNIDASGAYNGHAGASHQDGRDIIPAFSFVDSHGNTVSFPGQNLQTDYSGATGAELLVNGCKPPAQPSPTPTPTPTPPPECGGKHNPCPSPPPQPPPSPPPVVVVPGPTTVVVVPCPCNCPPEAIPKPGKPKPKCPKVKKKQFKVSFTPKHLKSGNLHVNVRVPKAWHVKRVTLSVCTPRSGIGKPKTCKSGKKIVVKKLVIRIKNGKGHLVLPLWRTDIWGKWLYGHHRMQFSAEVRAKGNKKPCRKVVVKKPYFNLDPPKGVVIRNGHAVAVSSRSSWSRSSWG